MLLTFTGFVYAVLHIQCFTLPKEFMVKLTAVCNFDFFCRTHADPKDFKDC